MKKLNYYKETKSNFQKFKELIKIIFLKRLKIQI